MNEKILKTVKWSDAKELISSRADRSFGRAKKGKPADFNGFIVAYPTVTIRRMADFLNGIVLDDVLKDVTDEFLLTEDSCLLDASTATSIEIMLRYLRTLNTGGKIKSLWAYLDTEEKAVVHFINRKGWYAEAYFSCSDNMSVLHLLVSPDGEKSFIPVTFTSDLSRFTREVRLRGGFCLHDYLPRVKCNFLSKKGRKNESSASNKLENSGVERHDKWDSL